MGERIRFTSAILPRSHAAGWIADMAAQQSRI